MPLLKKRRFIHNALMLTIITLLLRGIGTWFMIYISNQIGSEGIGLYQLTSSIYLLAVTLATSGITVAVIRVVSEQFALNNTVSAKKAFKICFDISLVLGLLSCAILYVNAEFIGNTLLGDKRTILSLKYLAIGLPFLSTSSVIRGYFLGMSRPIKSVSTDIVEQMSMIIVTVPILTICLPKGLEYACCGLVLGSTFSEIISCLYALVLYMCEKNKMTGIECKGICHKIFSIAAPIAISNYIRSILISLENILIPVGLKQYGATAGEALSNYGMIKGMAMPILFFPSAILSAFSSLLVPEVSRANAINAKMRIDFIVNKCFKVTIMFSILIAGIFICYSTEISVLFYGSKKVGTILLILAPLVPLMYLDQIVDSILKGLNQQLSSMKYNTIDSFIRVIIIYSLVPILGIKGYIIMLYVGTIFNASLSINRLIVVSEVRFRLYEWVMLPVISIVISCLFTRVLFICPVVFCVLAVTLIYILLLFIFQCITKRDIRWMKQVFARSNIK
ncbi:MAG: oligosaccharide flippase family protein [Oscillospiraceae bacterium]